MSSRLLKRMISGALALTLVFSINGFAAVVTDSDGSAFITKAEFDSLKNGFQAQIDSYNQAIDSKIDGAIAAYLAGIRISSMLDVTNLYSQLKVSGEYINDGGNIREGACSFYWRSGTDAVSYNNKRYAKIGITISMFNGLVDGYQWRYDKMLGSSAYCEPDLTSRLICDTNSSLTVSRTARPKITAKFTMLKIINTTYYDTTPPIPGSGVHAGLQSIAGPHEDLNQWTYEKFEGTGFGYMSVGYGTKNILTDEPGERELALCPESTTKEYLMTEDGYADIVNATPLRLSNKTWAEYLEYFQLEERGWWKLGNGTLTPTTQLKTNAASQASYYEGNIQEDGVNRLPAYDLVNTGLDSRDLIFKDFQLVCAANGKARYGVVLCRLDRKGKLYVSFEINKPGYVICYQSDSGTETWTTQKTASNLYTAGQHTKELEIDDLNAGGYMFILYLPSETNISGTLEVNKIQLQTE